MSREGEHNGERDIWLAVGPVSAFWLGSERSQTCGDEGEKAGTRMHREHGLRRSRPPQVDLGMTAREASKNSVRAVRIQSTLASTPRNKYRYTSVGLSLKE
ncbi:hypothetical protein AcV5_008250 [Taiwanofungus camphoratus]|nr:hypothetical protein AcV5_008250 [Antrodia cinnamomea]KAI0955635.1 hypothetical protein AcV7_006249 [Antrodia cinnamomea]